MALGTYSNTWVFQSVGDVLSVTCTPGFVCLWTNDLRLTDGERLFSFLVLERVQDPPLYTTLVLERGTKGVFF